MITEKQKILILSPHTDDAELGAGGYISKLLEEKHEIMWVVFSSARLSVPEGMPNNTLALEFESVVHSLSITNYKIFDYKVRRLHEHRQDVLESLVQARNEFNPDIVIGPSIHDYHQDHQVVAHEMIRAFKSHCSIICYELPWNNVQFDNQMFVRLEKRHIDAKINLLQHYKSQIVKQRNYFDSDFIIGQARVKGTCVACKYAESFEVIRWIV
ncbi:MAG: PIG-L deacetylase family protein [Bacteroidota bacterium]